MTGVPETRQSLLLRLHDLRDQRAWEEFVEIYEPLLYRIGRSQGLQHADALDLSQDVFAAVGNAIKRFDPDPEKGSFRGWLNRIARNLAINLLTRRNGFVGTGQTAVQKLLEQEPEDNDDALSWFELEYRRELFRCAADRVRVEFEAETWRAFWLTSVESEATRDVASLLGKSEGAVRLARCRVLARLKQEIARLQDEEAYRSELGENQS